MEQKKELGTYVEEWRWKKMLEEAGDGVSLIRSKKHPKVYEGVVKLNGSPFADEVDKYALLRILQQEAGIWGYDVIAFTLLDDELHLLLALQKRRRRRKSEPSAFIEQLNGAYDAYFSDKDKKYGTLLREQPLWKEIDEQEALLQKCYEIHTLARKSGYSREERDFWWSSLNAYNGHYLWEFVNIWHLLSYFSIHPREAWEFYQSDFKERRKRELMKEQSEKTDAAEENQI